MKPNKLILENIGPFTEKTVIDFSELGSMFLICGDTGAGKTTILDSICYALYGSLPGSHPRMARNLRSDFAPKDAAARVIFDFSINGSRYKIERNPPKPYTDRNGKESEKPAEVVLYELAGGGADVASSAENWNVLFNKTQEADAAISRLIGLSIKEFSKIVLLPQGDFAEFLRLSSNERKTALAKLFPIDDYRLITEFAKNKADEFINSQKQITAQIENLQKTFDFENADAQIEKLAETEKSYNDELAEINKLQMQLAAQLEKARALNQKFDDLEQLNKENAAVLAQKSAIESLEQKLEQNRKALLVKPVYENFKDLENRLETSGESLKQTENRLKEAEAEKEKLENGRALYEDKCSEIEKLPTLIRELERALAVEKDMVELKETCALEAQRKDELSARLEKAETYLASLQKEVAALEASILPQDDLDEAYDKANSELEEAKNKKKYFEEYQKLQKEVQQNKEGLDSSFARYENAKKNLELLKVEIQELESAQKVYDQNQKAFSLAKDLKEGEPCPVCGSVHHPKLADFLNEDFSIQERLNQKKANLPETESIERETFGIYSGVKSRYEEALRKLESAEKPCGDVQQLFEQAIQNMNEAVSKRNKNRQNNNRLLDNRRKQDNLLKERGFIQNELQSCLQNYTSLKTRYENLKGNFDSLTGGRLNQNETAATAMENFKQKLSDLRDETADYEKQCEDAAKLINECSATKELIFSQTNELRQQFEISAENLKKKLTENDFDSPDSLKAAFLTEEERVSFENQCK
ncbi:MAG: AAA family ATPase [Spirochaetaceae bacterium]|nr:AAA family ATPase [Spirochaetaceae bacterium]